MAGFWVSNMVGLYETGTSVFIILMVVGIAAVTMGNERDKNTFNLMLAMPYTRQQIINSKFVTGIAAIGAIFTANALFITLLMQAFSRRVARPDYGFGFTVSELWMWALINIIVLAYIFTFTLLISTLSGTMLGNGILSIIFLAFPMGFTGLILMNIDYWFVETGYTGYTIWTWWVELVAQITVPAYLLFPIEEYPTFAKFNTPLVYVIIMLSVGVLYGLTVWLFNKNSMEHNGEVLMFSQLEGIFKLGVTVCFGLLGGAINGNLFYNYSAVFTILGYLLAGGLAYWAVDRLIERRKGGR